VKSQALGELPLRQTEAQACLAQGTEQVTLGITKKWFF
jgi:hypothetical protein